MDKVKELKLDDERISRRRIGDDGSLSYDGRHWLTEVVMAEIDNPHSETGKSAVRVLSVDEARALISGEYGFEYNGIEITDVCWYYVSDYNYFSFSVHGRKYEVENFGALKIVLEPKGEE